MHWRLILEEYGRKIQYIPRVKNIAEDAISTFLSNGKPKSTHKYNYVAETLLEMYEVEEIPNGTFPFKFTTIEHYQRGYPGIKSKLLSTKCKKESVHGGQNLIKMVTHQDKIVITQKRSTLVPYVYPPSWTGSGGGNYSPTFILSQHNRSCTNCSKKC